MTFPLDFFFFSFGESWVFLNTCVVFLTMNTPGKGRPSLLLGVSVWVLASCSGPDCHTLAPCLVV